MYCVVDCGDVILVLGWVVGGGGCDHVGRIMVVRMCDGRVVC